MKPKNLVFIMADEHNVNVLGCYGHPMVKTPNLDRLSANGTRFTNAYTNCPLCVPARATLATGKYVHEIGYWDGAHPYDGKIPSWGHRLQETGHNVVSIGKLHYRNTTDPTGFDEQIIPMHVTDGVGSIHGALRSENIPNTSCERLAKELGPGNSDYLRYDTEISEKACEWIESVDSSSNSTPWVLFISFISPHYPLIAPPEYYEMYPLHDVPLPKSMSVNDPKHHPWIREIRKGWPYDDYMNEEKRRMGIAAYFGMCSFMDANVGKILTSLNKSQLTQNTQIIYMSDHGENLGKRGLWGKMTMYEEAAAIPMIISGPEIPIGKTCSTPVSLIDIYPTILECVGEPLLEKEKSLPGRSLQMIANEPDDNERKVFSEYHGAGSPSAVYMLRMGKYKYISYLGYSPELFDLELDPEEEENLANEKEYSELVKKFDTLLNDILNPEETDKKAKLDQAALIARLGGKEAILKKKTFAGTPPPKI
tara:strand:+ start:4891 stop:6330 length:1440 start_codon:yes stop_codon:yes gene_type:complete